MVPSLTTLSTYTTSSLTLMSLRGARDHHRSCRRALVHGLHAVEDLFERIHGRYLRHVLGMLLVGILMYALFERFGHYYVGGVGYATIQAILRGQIAASG